MLAPPRKMAAPVERTEAMSLPRLCLAAAVIVAAVVLPGKAAGQSVASPTAPAALLMQHPG